MALERFPTTINQAEELTPGSWGRPLRDPDVSADD